MNCSFGCRKYRDRLGVLLVQLGTPDAPTPRALKEYLREFLSDPRVIEVNRFVWKLVLNFVILPTRPKESAEKYARIWGKDGSPLLTITQRQTEKLRERLQRKNPNILVEFGMRLGKPKLSGVIDKMIGEGCTRIVVLPLFPQYSGATTASMYDGVFPELLRRRVVPTVRVVEPFFRHPLYIEALAQEIEKSYAAGSSRPEKVLLSYHGLPKRYVDAGDPYCCMCVETSRLVMQKLSIPREKLTHTYQSRFGTEQWLTPYTDETIAKLAKEGTKHVAVAAPSFVADCLETLDEIGNEARHMFTENGGETFTLVPCVNDNDKFIDCLEALVSDVAHDWLAEGLEAEHSEGVHCPAIGE